ASTTGGPVIFFAVGQTSAPFTATIGGIPVAVIAQPSGAASPYVLVAPPHPPGPADFVVTNSVDHTTASVTITYVDLPVTGFASPVVAVSTRSDGTEGTARGVGSGALGGAASGDGRYVAFFTETDLGFGASTNLGFGAYVKDLQTGALSPLTDDTPNSCVNFCGALSISLDGLTVAHITDLPGGSGRYVVATRAPFPGSPQRVDVNDQGQPAPGDAGIAALSGSGRFVVFTTTANLDADVGDVATTADLFVRDLAGGHTERWTTNVAVTSASITADGRYIAFTTTASLVPDDTNGVSDVYVIDRSSASPAAPAYRLITLGANGASTGARISADGSTLAFTSGATTLGVVDTNGVADVYWASLPDGAIRKVLFQGAENVAAASAASVSGNGRWIALATAARPPVADALPAVLGTPTQPYVFDRFTGETFPLNANAAGEIGDYLFAVGTSLSPDGRRALLLSLATNLLTTPDTNALFDDFSKEMPLDTRVGTSVLTNRSTSR